MFKPPEALCYSLVTYVFLNSSSVNVYYAARCTSLQVGQTALHLAVRHGRASTVRLLLAHGANINAQDQAGTTALISACDRGHTDIVRILLQDPDCDANLTDKVRLPFRSPD